MHCPYFQMSERWLHYIIYSIRRIYRIKHKKPHSHVTFEYFNTILSLIKVFL